MESASIARAEMWVVGAVDSVKVKLLLSASASQSLLLFPVIKKKLAENSLSFLHYCSVDTQTLLQRCLNTNV